MWNEVLPRAGYQGIDIMADGFSADKDAAVIVATAAEEKIPTPGPLVSPARAVSLVNCISLMGVSKCSRYHRCTAKSRLLLR